MLFRCFAKQDRLTDVRTDRKAPVKDSRSCSCSQGSTTKWRGDVCGGVECPAPEKSPDLGNSSPDPRAFMYIESATDLSGKQARNIHLKDRRFVRRSRTRTGLRLGGCGQDLRTGVTDTD